MKKIIILLILFLWVMGIVGGIGYSIWQGAWPVAVGVLVCGWLSWPRVVELYKGLVE